MPTWHKVAHPSTWTCDHEWERVGLLDWGIPVDKCVHCKRERTTDINGVQRIWRKGRWTR